MSQQQQQQQQHQLHLHDYNYVVTVLQKLNIKLQFKTMIIQCNDYHSQSSVISMI